MILGHALSWYIEELLIILYAAVEAVKYKSRSNYRVQNTLNANTMVIYCPIRVS